MDCYLPNQIKTSSLYKGSNFNSDMFNLILSYSSISEFYNKPFHILKEDKLGKELSLGYNTIETNTSGPVLLGLIDLLINILKPKSILELGTFVGVSTRLLGGDRDLEVVSIEIKLEFVEVAWKNIHKNTTIMCNSSLDALKEFKREGRRFDLIFVDSGKEEYADYITYLSDIVNDNGIILFDDIFFHGDVFNLTPTTSKGIGIKKFLEKIKQDERYYKLILPIGNGVLIMIKK